MLSVTRPPPLQLQHDNLRPGLRPRPLQPKHTHASTGLVAFAKQLYQADWRNLVIAVTGISALWFFIEGLTAFHDAHFTPVLPHTHAPPTIHLSHLTLARAALHLATSLLLAGAGACALFSSPSLVRAHTRLAAAAALLILLTGLLKTALYFGLAEEMIMQCATLAASGLWVPKTLFHGKLRPGQVPSTHLAQQQCLSAWSYALPSRFLALLLFSVLPALALVLLTRAWASQTRDARHVGCIRVALADHKYTEEHDSMEAGGWGCGWIWGWGCTRRGKGGGYVVLGQDDEEAQAQGPQMDQRPHQDRHRAPQRPSYLLPPPSQVEEPYALTPGPPSFAVRASAGYGRYAYADLGDVQTGTGADWRK